MLSFKNIISQQKFSLPICYISSTHGSFLNFLEKQFANTIEPSYMALLQSHEKDFIINLMEGIIQSFRLYISGKTFESYQIFSSVLSSYSVFTLHFPRKTYPEKTSFFRIRTKENLSDRLYERKEMFHHPFDQRNKIRTQRYSIPSFPCLYVGDSFYVCWEELNRPDLRRVQAVRLESRKPFDMLTIDLGLYGDNSIVLDEIKAKALLLFWPLFFVCSIEIEDKKRGDPFKEEYVMPQFLLQFLRSYFYGSIGMETIGIQYGSTRLKSSLHQHLENSFFNLVLPPLDLKEDKLKTCGIYSRHLAELFNMTDVIDIGNHFKNTRNKSKQSSVVSIIEPHHGIKLNYKTSEYGKIEQYLMKQPVLPIDFII